MQLDKDLASIQEVRNLVAAAKNAQKILAGYDQARIDALVEAVGVACEAQAERLAAMAVEETGFGVAADKTLKNRLASRGILDSVRGMKTVGVIREDGDKGITDIAVPVGVVAALIPSTNPTSTVIYKALISLKAGNAVVFSPHPNAKKCIFATVDIIREAVARVGAPEYAVEVIRTPTIDATNALMRHPDTGLILATGGPGMVKAAYSSGNPALGVGAGNGPAFIERSADIALAVKHIIDSKTFDNGTICASEQSIVVESCIRDRVVEEATRQGCLFLDGAQTEKLARILLRPSGSMNPAIVGRSAQDIARMVGLDVTADTRALVSAVQTEVSHNNPYSREKLCPVLGFYVEDDWVAACERSIEILHNEGMGHTMVIHSRDEKIIREFALKKPVMRLLVNTPAALGGVGATTNLPPAFTLGCGALGKTATSDNVTPLNLINIRRLARGVREVEELRGATPTTVTDAVAKALPRVDAGELEKIVAEVVARLTCMA